MAFPTTITTGGDANKGGAIPYLSSAGNVYVIVHDDTTTSKIRAFKATDPTSSFSNVGTDVTVTSGNEITGLGTVQAGDVIHVVSQDTDVASTGVLTSVLYHKFDMASDTWSLTNEAISTAFNVATIEARDKVAINLRSNGDAIVLYNGPKVANMGTDRNRVYYARRVSGTWTSDVVVDNGGATSWICGVTVSGSSDRSHFFFLDDGADDGYQRTLTSANTLETFPASFDTTTASSPNIMRQGNISYNSSGTQKVRSLYGDSTSNTLLNIAKCDSADAPTMSTETDITGATDTNGVNNIFMSSLSADGTTLWNVFIDSNLDVYTQSNADDAGWSAPVSFYTGSVVRVYSNVYTRNGDIVLAMVFSETDPKYTEKTLSAATQPPQTDFDFVFDRIRR